MGQIVWNEWARLICLCGSFVLIAGGILGAFQPMPAFDALWKLSVLFRPFPILSVILIVLGVILWIIEWPLIYADYLSSPAALVPKIAFYVPVAVLALLSGQTNNGGIYLGIGTFGYVMALRDDFKRQQQSWSRLA